MTKEVGVPQLTKLYAIPLAHTQAGIELKD